VKSKNMAKKLETNPVVEELSASFGSLQFVVEHVQQDD
jgi:hypothetical protein